MFCTEPGSQHFIVISKRTVREPKNIDEVLEELLHVFVELSNEIEAHEGFTNLQTETNTIFLSLFCKIF